jgi:hypothetical protein
MLGMSEKSMSHQDFFFLILESAKNHLGGGELIQVKKMDG